MRLPRWSWEVGTVFAVGVLAVLIAREMLRPLAPPVAAAPAAAAAAPIVATAAANAPRWFDPSLDPEAFRRAYPTPFEPVPVERQRNGHKLRALPDPAQGSVTVY